MADPFSNLGSSDFGSEANDLRYFVAALLSTVRTTGPVKVLSVTNSGGVSPIGYVNVQPLVGQVDGLGNIVPHATIYNVPYMRVQGGANAVILDPQVGDVGLAAFCDRDISAVKASGGASGPGSRRKFDMSDAVYLFSIMATAPTQYVEFNTTGITVHSPTKVTISAPAIATSGTWNHTGTLVSTGNITAGGIDLETHNHTGVQPGSSNTGGPTG